MIAGAQNLSKPPTPVPKPINLVLRFFGMTGHGFATGSMAGSIWAWVQQPQDMEGLGFRVQALEAKASGSGY